MDTWQTLKTPPVALALLQLKFSPQSVKLEDFNQYKPMLMNMLPVYKENIHLGLDLSDVRIPLGKSTITSKSDAKINSFVLLSNDQKERLEFSEGTISYIDEHPYSSWNSFKERALQCLMTISETLNSVEILRTSIRFINRFNFKEFSKPEDYFNSVISSSGKPEESIPYPLRQYNFKLVMDIPASEIYSIVNHGAEPGMGGEYIYTLDIDVLNRERFIFEQQTLNDNLEKLRVIKNKLFFSSLTQKTIDLCK